MKRTKTRLESFTPGQLVAVMLIALVGAVMVLAGIAGFVMLGIGVFHSVFPAIPALGYGQSLALTAILWLVYKLCISWPLRKSL